MLASPFTGAEDATSFKGQARAGGEASHIASACLHQRQTILSSISSMPYLENLTHLSVKYVQMCSPGKTEQDETRRDSILTPHKSAQTCNDPQNPLIFIMNYYPPEFARLMSGFAQVVPRVTNAQSLTTLFAINPRSRLVPLR